MKSNLLYAGILLAILTVFGCHDNHDQSRLLYSNPGGMWMPHQLTGQIQTLQALGVEKPDRLTNPLGYPLGAIVWLGGCSASFVSPDGLIITNYHCSNSTLQFLSTPEQNLFEEGFLAGCRQKELPAETGKKVWITQELIDVTKPIREGLGDISDPQDRFTEIENRIKKLIKQHEQPAEGIRCEVKKYFEGEKYYLLKFLELRDIRLVYAPPESIGAYGGDIDNWHWPRHTADFTFYRAYVSPSGRPAEFAAENIPYRPKHWLRIASEPLREHDFVMVAGFPGRTARWDTYPEVSWTFQKYMPARIQILRDVASIYKELAEESEPIKIKVTPSIKGVMNALQKYELVLENVQNSDLLEQKAAEYHRLQSYLENRQNSGLPDQIERLHAEQQIWDMRDYLLHCITNYVRLIDAAHTIVRMAEERPKPDPERDPDCQQRNWDRRIQALQRMQRSYDPKIDKAIFLFYLRQIQKLPAEQMQTLPAVLLKEDTADSLFSDTLILDDADRRVELFQNASMEELQQSRDPAFQLALQIRPLTQDIEDRDEIYQGKMALLRPLYVQALRDMNHSQPMAPDANGTLRVTYGTVKGYRPQPAAECYRPFTTLDQLMDKYTGTNPFDLPETFRNSAKQKQNSPYYWPAINDVPVNFLSDVDITGGNSGSATLNRKGQLVGLVFDGNSESLASDWLFDPEITRGIHVDIRYVLWIMRDVDQADHLLRELGIE